jgi:hypothetical protein
MKSTRILGWVALGLVAGAAVIHCGGDDSNSVPPSGNAGQSGSHAGASGSSSGNAGTSSGASGSAGAGQNAGGMSGSVNNGGAGMGGVAGTAGAGGGDASTGDARDSASTSDSGPTETGSDVTSGSDSTSGSDVTSPTDGSAVDASTAADTGTADANANVCPGSSPGDNTACSVTVAGGCSYGQQRCFCTGFGQPADAGRRWQCFGTPPSDASTADAGAGCPGTKPEGGVACSMTGQFCNFGGGGLNFCFCDNNQQWFCF